MFKKKDGEAEGEKGEGKSGSCLDGEDDF